ncbi:MAG: amidohydrolase family protein [Pseudomonadaceae bacterium]|nr:amidohydrolase family protein [Pseudomonadaceae bacterium]
MFDVIIRGGSIVDGSGAPSFIGDVAIKDGRIAEVGKVDGAAAREINAAGRVVAPGFIDPHTHFDAQLLWDGAAKPALEHGITTIVPGNCSLSLAPLKVEHREALTGMFRQIEELPPEVFDGSAFDWTWESFDDYLKAIREGLSVNVAPLVGHSVIRLWVMGDAAQQRAANPQEIQGMCELLRECLQAGAVGLSTSYVDVDQNLYPVPSRWAHFEELDALAAVLGEYGRVLQVVPEFYATDITLARVDQLAELSLKHDIPTTFSPLFDNAATPDNVPRVMARVHEQMARGARVWPQVQTRPIDISFSFELPSLFFAANPTWYTVMRLPYAERTTAFTDPDQRAKLVAAAGPDGGASWLGSLILRHVPDAASKLVGQSVAQIASERGVSPVEALIDVSLEHDFKAHFLAESVGHDVNSRVGPLLADDNVHIGASDGGAHIASFSTYGDTGYLFSEFVRATGELSLEHAVRKITSDTARIWGIPERGELAPGFAADVVIFDADTIARGPERMAHDLPGVAEGGLRYVRDSVGVETVLVNGAVAFESGAYTDAHSGQVAVA